MLCDIMRRLLGNSVTGPYLLGRPNAVSAFCIKTRPSRPIRCAVWIVERMRYPTDRQTDRPTDRETVRQTVRKTDTDTQRQTNKDRKGKMDSDRRTVADRQ